MNTWTCSGCRVFPNPFSTPLHILERWAIVSCPSCGHATPAPRSLNRAINREIKDAKLLARLRALARSEYAGLIDSKCLEPSCRTCRDETFGLFRTPAVRCEGFERLVLPLDPALEEAYFEHLHAGTAAVIRRCKWENCRRGTASLDPNSRYCALHARLAERHRERERARTYRERRKEGPGVTVLPSTALANNGLAKGVSFDPESVVKLAGVGA